MGNVTFHDEIERGKKKLKKKYNIIYVQPLMCFTFPFVALKNRAKIVLAFSILNFVIFILVDIIVNKTMKKKIIHM